MEYVINLVIGYWRKFMSCEPRVSLSIPSRCWPKTAWRYPSDNPKFYKLCHTIAPIWQENMLGYARFLYIICSSKLIVFRPIFAWGKLFAFNIQVQRQEDIFAQNEGYTLSYRIIFLDKSGQARNLYLLNSQQFALLTSAVTRQSIFHVGFLTAFWTNEHSVWNEGGGTE